MADEPTTDLIASEAAVLLAAAVADLTVPLVVYPEWTMLDLLVHTGSVHRRTTRIVVERPTERPERVYPPSEDPEAIPGWFEDGYREMVEILRAADPEMPVWGFGKDPTVGFWVTRMALETSTHRWDAQRAVGAPEPLLSDLAVQGIDEYGWLHRPPRPEDWPHPGDFLALHATDAEAEWVLTDAGDRFRMRRGSAPARAAASAGASELYLWLMGRVDMVRVAGDGDVVARWESAVRYAPTATR